ncbi:hypothetical protein [Solicola sp. PLA-1-18]|uniref:hypothetical protein n=1 Tax=Solicola sp. PLA-1-18 TaxID=3380532 RepID=UPI003B7D7337
MAIIVLMPLVKALDWPYWADLLLAMGIGLAGGMVRNLVRRLRARRSTSGVQQAADVDHRNDHSEGQESDPRQ